MNQQRPFRVVHVIASLAESSGGPPRSVTSLCEELAKLGCHVQIVTLDTLGTLGPSVQVNESLVKVHRCPCYVNSKLRIAIPRGFMQTLRKVAVDADLIHSHGLWLSVNRDAARIAAELSIPHLISPRGNLHPASLQRSGWKKRLARKLYVNRMLEKAKCLHATAKDEARHFQELGLRNPVAILPTGIRVPDYSESELRTSYHEKWPELSDRKVMLFLGRIHPHKGVLNLAEAWGAIAPQAPDWHLVFAGPDEIGCRTQVEDVLRRSDAANQTIFVGPVSGIHKWALYSNAELFVLPSQSENFGLSIAEALAMGCPVLTTDTTPWQDLEKHQCGWRIPVGATPLVAKLREIMEMPQERLRAMRKPAARLIVTHYQTEKIAKQMFATYQWLTQSGPHPDCVRDNTLPTLETIRASLD